MKKVFSVLLCVLILCLAGCEGADAKYSLDDAKKAFSDTFGYEYDVTECTSDSFWGIDDCYNVYVTSNDYNDAPFDYLDVYVFDTKKYAKAFYDKLVNEEYDGIELNDSGDNYCWLSNYNMCDVVGNCYLQIDSNVVIMAEALFSFEYSTQNGTDAEIAYEERFLSFIENDIPKFFDALD